MDQWTTADTSGLARTPHPMIYIEMLGAREHVRLVSLTQKQSVLNHPAMDNE